MKLKSLVLALLLLIAPSAIPQQTQQPSGATLAFTMNYLNTSVESCRLTLTGTALTCSWDRVGDRGYRTANLLDFDKVIPDQYGVTVFCKNYKMCVSQSGEMSDGPQYAPTHWGGPNIWLILTVKANGNTYKSSDVANALTHLIALVRAQHDADLKQQQQQNQTDPFANPQ